MTTHPEPESESTSSPARRVQRIVDEWLVRRARGDSMDIIGTLKANPDLHDLLLSAIRKLAMLPDALDEQPAAKPPSPGEGVPTGVDGLPSPPPESRPPSEPATSGFPDWLESGSH